MPEVMADQTRTGTYGSWYQYYICGVSARIVLPLVGEASRSSRRSRTTSRQFEIKSTAERCQR